MNGITYSFGNVQNGYLNYGRFQGISGAGDVGENTLKITVSDGINKPVAATMKVMVAFRNGAWF